jgi:hypothetical protein
MSADDRDNSLGNRESSSGDEPTINALGSSSAALDLVNKILSVGVNGLGPYKSAADVAEEALSHHGNAEIAIDRLVATHRRWVGSTGFASGLGGLMTLPVTLPADVTTFYMLSARMSAGIAFLRGYDIKSEEVQSAVLISLLGASAAGALGKIGVEVGNKVAVAALNRLPGRVLLDINRRVGFRLLTKFGTRGAINLVKAVPLVGGGVGAGVNVAAINQIARYSKSTFVPLGDTTMGKSPVAD